MTENIGLTLRARLKSQVLIKEDTENIVDAEQLVSSLVCGSDDATDLPTLLQS